MQCPRHTPASGSGTCWAVWHQGAAGPMASQSLGAPESLQVELIHRQGRPNGGLPFSLGVSTACAGERK